MAGRGGRAESRDGAGRSRLSEEEAGGARGCLRRMGLSRAAGRLRCFRARVIVILLVINGQVGIFREPCCSVGLPLQIPDSSFLAVGKCLCVLLVVSHPPAALCRVTAQTRSVRDLSPAYSPGGIHEKTWNGLIF